MEEQILRELAEAEAETVKLEVWDYEKGCWKTEEVNDATALPGKNVQQDSSSSFGRESQRRERAESSSSLGKESQRNINGGGNLFRALKIPFSLYKN